MTSANAIVLHPGIKTPMRGGNQKLFLTLEKESISYAGRVSIEIDGRVLGDKLDFVPLLPGGSSGSKFVGEVHCIIDDACRFILIGDHEIIRVDCSEARMSRICDLNRRPDDDRGFYRLRIQQTSDYLLVIYEGGVLRLGLEGEVLWHAELSWDDLYDRHDEEYIYYNTEYGRYAPHGFKIDLQTGMATAR